jgi:hypothetical protein
MFEWMPNAFPELWWKGLQVKISWQNLQISRNVFCCHHYSTLLLHCHPVTQFLLKKTNGNAWVDGLHEHQRHVLFSKGLNKANNGDASNHAHDCTTHMQLIMIIPWYIEETWEIQLSNLSPRK